MGQHLALNFFGMGAIAFDGAVAAAEKGRMIEVILIMTAKLRIKTACFATHRPKIEQLTVFRTFGPCVPRCMSYCLSNACFVFFILFRNNRYAPSEQTVKGIVTVPKNEAAQVLVGQLLYSSTKSAKRSIAGCKSSGMPSSHEGTSSTMPSKAKTFLGVWAL